MDPVPFDVLSRADLVLDRTYSGGTAGNASDDPLGRLLPVGNQGGFRFKGSVTRGTVRLVVLYTSGAEPDWPDEIDPTTGDFTYYGDNRHPGRELHDTPRSGNVLLRDIFHASRADPDARRHVPPIFLFQRSGQGRDVIFRGLLAPGSSRLNADEELVAVWRTTKDLRFQNYRSHFTVLKTPRIPRSWLDEVLAGDPLGAHCPREWRLWVQSRIYEALEAPRTIVVRSKTDQLPDARDMWMLEAIHRHFSPAPDRFEHMAADMWVNSDPHVSAVEVTRPSRDGGRDAVGEFRIGPRQDPIRLSFALEAKCFSPTHGVGVKAVSRLISRIKHREFGVFVTTSFIGEQAYREVREDDHPVIFMTGRDIVDNLKRMGLAQPEALDTYLRSKHPVEPAEPQGSYVDVVHPGAGHHVAITEDLPADGGATRRSAGRSR